MLLPVKKVTATEKEFLHRKDEALYLAKVNG
jgi:hypothetical protein